MTTQFATSDQVQIASAITTHSLLPPASSSKPSPQAPANG